MFVIPLASAAIAGWFAASLWRSWTARRSPFLRSWAIAMGMYAAASAAVAAGVLDGWSLQEFRVYWALGAVLNVPMLALGEVELLARDARVRGVTLAVVALVAVATLAVTWTAPVDAAALGAGLPSGRVVFGDGSLAHRLPQVIAIPSYLVLVAGALWSIWRMRGRRDLRDRALGTGLIALGATVIAGLASAFAALGMAEAFSISLVVGVATMFSGFRVAIRVR